MAEEAGAKHESRVGFRLMSWKSASGEGESCAEVEERALAAMDNRREAASTADEEARQIGGKRRDAAESFLLRNEVCRQMRLDPDQVVKKAEAVASARSTIDSCQ